MSTAEQAEAPANGHRAEDVATLRAQILADRARLAETVSALTAKLDVKAHMRRKVANVKQRASDTGVAFGRTSARVVDATATRVRSVARPAVDVALAIVFVASATVAVTVAVAVAVAAGRERRQYQ